jgi:hypothetical protein
MNLKKHVKALNIAVVCKNIFLNLGILPFPCIFIYECAMFLKNHEAKFREHV